MPHRLESSMAKLVDKDLQRHTVLQRDGNGRTKAIHQTADRAPFFGHGDENFSRSTVWIEANVEVTLVTADAKLVRNRIASVW